MADRIHFAYIVNRHGNNSPYVQPSPYVHLHIKKISSRPSRRKDGVLEGRAHRRTDLQSLGKHCTQGSSGMRMRNLMTLTRQDKIRETIRLNCKRSLVAAEDA